MQIRAPLTTEVFGLVDMIVRLHPMTRFHGDVAVDEKYARTLLAQCIQRNGGQHDGGTFIRVCENDDGRLCGFVAGMLDRVYHVGDLLWAQDMFLLTEPDAPFRASTALIDGYVDWAWANPKVYEVHLSHLDALPDLNRLDRHFEKRWGFQRCGAVFRLTKNKEANA